MCDGVLRCAGAERCGCSAARQGVATSFFSSFTVAAFMRGVCKVNFDVAVVVDESVGLGMVVQDAVVR